jgi:hypothetical protein
MYGLEVGILTAFEILGHFVFQGDGTTLYGNELYTISCPLKQKYVWFRGGDLIGF